MSESGSQLRGGRGNTTVSDAVVAKVAGVAAQEVEKVQMGGGATAAVGGFLGSVTGSAGAGLTRGVSVEVGAEEAAVDLTLAIEYGAQIPQTAQAVRRNAGDLGHHRVAHGGVAPPAAKLASALAHASLRCSVLRSYAHFLRRDDMQQTYECPHTRLASLRGLLAKREFSRTFRRRRTRRR